MKLENLAIIFVIIIVPITIVLSEYIDGKIDTKKLELEYNKRLLASTQAAINAYKANTIDNQFADDTNSKITDITTSTNIFMNSLAASFNYVGQKAGQMKEYVPAVAFTLYDGYYIYSPFNNTLTEVEDNDETYSKNNELYYGLKPYVYYTCRYKTDDGLYDFYITYTLDNYITINGKVNGINYVYDYGYLYKGIAKNGNTYTYNGVEFKETETEEMKEYVGDIEYSYVKINGTKYYLDNESIFYIDNNGNKNVQVSKAKDGALLYSKYENAIKTNKSAYEYYKNAYEFSNKVYNTYHLQDLKTSNATIYSINDEEGNTTDLQKYGDFKIFDGDPQYESSNFNNHRKAVIRYVVETNLAAAISGYSSKYVDSFIMPKISEEDWDLIQNNSCAISFMQGMSLGNKKYNGYSVVANSFTKEHIDENDIYILSNDNTYCRVNDSALNNNVKSKGDYYAGIWKLNFEKVQGVDSLGNTIYYVPVGFTTYTGSYTSIVGIKGTNKMPENDVYKYLEQPEISSNTELKKAYYFALGRERWGSFNINNVNFEIYGGNGSQYFLNDY